MHDHLHPFSKAACDELAMQVPALNRAAKFSKSETQAARAFFSERLGSGHSLDIVVCGSMARQEMSSASDFDYLVIAHGLVEDASLFREYRKACDDWARRRAIKPPGSTGIFGRVVSGSELVEQIGLEYDTNASLTRRVLVLEEGVSVLEPDLHEKFVRVAVGRYLVGGQSDASGPPRFLLNDVIRYWRTIAVDYQAKVWASLDDFGWGLRYLKLRISRKLTFVGTVVSALLVSLEQPEDPQAFLVEQFAEVPALARLAQLVPRLIDEEQSLVAIGQILAIADRFSAFLDDEDLREEAKGVEPPAGDAEEPNFNAMRDDSLLLQERLEELFFDSPTLTPLSRKYLSF